MTRSNTDSNKPTETKPEAGDVLVASFNQCMAEFWSHNTITI